MSAEYLGMYPESYRSARERDLAVTNYALRITAIICAVLTGIALGLLKVNPPWMWIIPAVVAAGFALSTASFLLLRWRQQRWLKKFDQEEAACEQRRRSFDAKVAATTRMEER